MLSRCCHGPSRSRTARRRPARRHLGRLALFAACGSGWLAAVRGEQANRAAHGQRRAGRPDAAGVTWLCRPGLAGDPCLYPEAPTRSPPTARRRSSPPRPRPSRPSTASTCIRPSPHPPPRRTPERRSRRPSRPRRWRRRLASPRCATSGHRPTASGPSASLAEGLGNDPTADLISYESLLAGWKDYLAHDNDGRPIVFIGHSQGAANLIRLLRSQVDDDPALRARMVVGHHLGRQRPGARGQDGGRDVRPHPGLHQGGPDRLRDRLLVVLDPAARRLALRAARSGCQPPIGPDGSSAANRSLCTNPAALGRTGAAPLTPYFVSRPAPTGEPWVTYPGLYTGTCESKGGATWLQIDARPGDSRPVVDAHARSDLGPPPRRRQPGARQPGERRASRGGGLLGAPQGVLNGRDRRRAAVSDLPAPRPCSLLGLDQGCP